MQTKKSRGPPVTARLLQSPCCEKVCPEWDSSGGTDICRHGAVEWGIKCCATKDGLENHEHSPST